VLTGDLTALGDSEELAQVRLLLTPLLAQGRLTVIPGNHDRYLTALAFESCFSEHLKSDLPEYADARGYPFVKLLGSRYALVGLDSTHAFTAGAIIWLADSAKSNFRH